MKRTISVILSALLLAVVLFGCGTKICRYCGKTIDDDPVEAGERTYCSYDHYLSEMFE